MGETVLKVKVPPVRIENSLSPLYRGTDFSTLAETFQTVWGGRDCLKSQTFLSENQEFALARYREMNKFNLEWTFETALEGVSTTATHSKIGFQGTYFIRFFNLSVLIDNYGK